VRESALFYLQEQFLSVGQTSRELLVDRVTEIATRVGQSEEIEVVEVILAGGGKARLLRIVIDKPTGVTHADCEFISHQVGTILDLEDLIPGEGYQLEVSSPWVERKLVKPADYLRFSGRKAKMSLSEPIEGQTHLEGVLRGLEDGDVVVIETAAEKTVRVPLQFVRKANLRFEW